MPASANERLAAARTAVDGACQLLLSPTPEQMDGCALLLETALAELQAFRQSTGFDDLKIRRESLAQAHSLRNSAARAKRLLVNADGFYTNWIRCLAALCAGYNAQGQPAALDRGGRLLAKG